MLKDMILCKKKKKAQSTCLIHMKSPDGTIEGVLGIGIESCLGEGSSGEGGKKVV